MQSVKSMTSQQNSISPGLDETALEQLVALGVLNKVGTLFLENSRSLIDEGRTATERGDLDTVAIVFHTLKSSSAMVGAAQLSQLSKLMEEMANDRNLNECQVLLCRLLDSHRKTASDLQDYLAQYQS